MTVDARSVAVGGAELEVLEAGTGEPVLLIQTALTADELVPVAEEPALAGYRRIVTRRRGYAGSSPVDGPGSITRDAADCAALLDRMSLDRAHVVGVSYSAGVALQLASDAPALVHTLTLMEPPPVQIPSADEFLAANDRLLQLRREQGVQVALEEILAMLIGPDWREITEQRLPGSADQMQRDAGTFFDTDVPALLHWRMDPDEIDRITSPVLHIGGADSGPWFAEVRRLVLDWFPGAGDVVIADADHSLAASHAPQVAGAVAGFLARHPMPG